MHENLTYLMHENRLYVQSTRSAQCLTQQRTELLLLLLELELLHDQDCYFQTCGKSRMSCIKYRIRERQMAPISKLNAKYPVYRIKGHNCYMIYTASQKMNPYALSKQKLLILKQKE